MIFIDACFGKKTPYTPVWMMRQAGRYLPEYMQTRTKAGDFLTLCKTPELACEVTLQPVEALGVDAAILFSDILVVPAEMGMNLRFEKGEGPLFETTINSLEALKKLNATRGADGLGYVYDAVRLVRTSLSPDKALIGFCGAPWTLATYMIEGKTTKTYNVCKRMLYAAPALLHAILREVTECLKLYISRQIEAGVNAVQIFDSWAGALEGRAYEEFGLFYINEICEFLKARYPHIPLIVFAKDHHVGLEKFAGCKFDVYGVDWGSELGAVKAALGERFVLQGNMEPNRLYSKDAIDEGVEAVLKVMQNRRHIFNLGHGILPDVPVENAKYFVRSVQERSRF